MLDAYCVRFAHLHTNRGPSHWSALTCYQAPHKPLLLLAVLDLVASGDLSPDFLTLTPQLIETFEGYWRILPGLDERVGNPVLPFFHLRYEGFWRLVPVPGQEQTLAAGAQISSLAQLQQYVLGATLAPDLAALLVNAEAREALRQVLIETYFAPEVQLALFQCGRVASEAAAYRQEIVALAQQPFTLIRPPAPQRAYLREARAAGFRQVVVEAYQQTCAFCRLRLVTPEGHTAVEAAHIVPWSQSYNDDPRNGLTLCRLHHWTFDEGLVGIRPDAVIEVSALVEQGANQAVAVQALHKQSLALPHDPTLAPAMAALRWHWQQVFRRA